MKQPRYLTPDEVADRLRVKKRTLYKWRLEGRGPASIKRGWNLLYKLTDVEAYERTLDSRAAA